MSVIILEDSPVDLQVDEESRSPIPLEKKSSFDRQIQAPGTHIVSEGRSRGAIRSCKFPAGEGRLMGLYRYSTERDGRTVEGTMTAPGLSEAIRQLRDRGVKPKQVKPVERSETQAGFGESERMWLYRHLAELLEADIPLHRALEATADDMPSPTATVRVREMAASVITYGLTLSEAMEQYPKIFGTGSVGVVRAAERAGRLPQSLRMLADYLEKMERLTQLALAPVIYPVILICIVLGTGGFSITYTVPKFLQLYLELGMERSEFPLPTRMASAISEIIPQIAWILIFIAVVLLMIYLVYRRSPRMRLDADIWSLWLPIFGRINREAATARILGILGISLDAGMPLHEAMTAAGPASGNEMMTMAMRRAADRARRGYNTAECFEPTGILSEGILWHLRSAEKSGTLPATCRTISDYFLRRGELITRRMAAILEPVLIILVGIFVGGLGYAMFLPLVQIVGELSS